MAAIEWHEVVDHYPALSTFDVHAGDDVVAFVNETVNVDAFGGEDSYKTKLARIHLAAHFAAIASTSALSGGPVKRRRVGDIEEEFATSSSPSDSEGMTQTAGGRAYLALLRSSLARVPVMT